jgi:hypothetical protein
MVRDASGSTTACDVLTCLRRAVDFVSMQATLFNGAARGWWAQTRTLVKLQARLTEDE